MSFVQTPSLSYSAFLVGYPPFSETGDAPPLHEQILKGRYTFPDEFWSGVSESAKDLIRKMMCVDPATRLTIAGVLEHPWLANDAENTSRVEKIMQPAAPVNRGAKRAASNELPPMDDDAGTSGSDSFANGRSKRMKH